jgi:transposase-like protein
MEKIAPSERIRKQIEELMTGTAAAKDGSDLTGQLLGLAVRRVIQELLEVEQAEALGRNRFERKTDGRGWRNGYEPGKLRTSAGKLVIERPQVRGTGEPFRSRVWDQLDRRTDTLERLAVEMYARGLSTRDIEDAFAAATGEPVLSRSSVSEITQTLWQEFEAFQQRDLACFALECLFLDAVYEKLRPPAGQSEALLCAWGILRDGRKVLLHLMLGNKESREAWLELMRSMVTRGLRLPLSITSDGAPGLLRAIDQVYPKSLRIRCWAHKMRNIEAKLPKDVVAEVRSAVLTVRDAATYEEGLHRAQEVIARYRDRYPSAMACLGEDLVASLNHLKLPARLRQTVRTTNLLERAFEEERRRSKVIPRFFSEKSGMKLAFAVLWRASQRWARVRFTRTELEQLDTVRAALGLVVREVEEPRLPATESKRCA